MQTIHIITLLLSIAAIIMSAICLTKKKEGYIGYPFQPIDPTRVDFRDAQSVYGMPGDLFDITSPDEGLHADKSLYMADVQGQIVRNLPEYKLNQGYDNDGNAVWDLSFSRPPIYAWSNY